MSLSSIPSPILLIAYIRSAAKLSYADAQNVIEGKSLGAVPVDDAFKAKDIEQDIKTLHGITQIFRDQRFKNGALASDSAKLSFSLDENGLPTDCLQYQRADSHKLIEEVRCFGGSAFILLADCVLCVFSSCWLLMLPLRNILALIFLSRHSFVVTTCRSSVAW